jgi:hypothetical protein
MNYPSNLRQAMATIQHRGLARTDREAFAWFRAWQAVKRGGSAAAVLRRPAFRRIPASRRAELANAVTSCLLSR